MAEQTDMGYTVTLDASRWFDEGIMHNDFARAFAFPDHYGRNLDALVDCLRDVAEVSPARDVGLVIVVRGFARFQQALPATASALLSILDDLATTSGVVSLVDQPAS